MVIYVTFFVDNHTIPIKVDPYDTVDNLKTLITLEEGIPVSQQILTFEGFEFKNGYTLADYGVQNEDTLQMTETVIYNKQTF